MGIPSAESLRQLFTHDGRHHAARMILALGREPDGRARLLDSSAAARDMVARSYGHPKFYQLQLAALVELGADDGIYGAEGFRTPHGYVCYLNTGDPYSLTLLRFPSGHWKLGTWGDVVESTERRYGYGCCNDDY